MEYIKSNDFHVEYLCSNSIEFKSMKYCIIYEIKHFNVNYNFEVDPYTFDRHVFFLDIFKIKKRIPKMIIGSSIEHTE